MSAACFKALQWSGGVRPSSEIALTWAPEPIKDLARATSPSRVASWSSRSISETGARGVGLSDTSRRTVWLIPH